MPKKTQTPAERVIAAFGGCRATGRAIGRTGSSVSRWVKPLGEGGSGGNIPTVALGLVLAAARRMNIDLKAEDLIAVPK